MSSCLFLSNILSSNIHFLESRPLLVHPAQLLLLTQLIGPSLARLERHMDRTVLHRSLAQLLSLILKLIICIDEGGKQEKVAKNEEKQGKNEEKEGKSDEKQEKNEERENNGHALDHVVDFVMHVADAFPALMSSVEPLVRQLSPRLQARFA